MFPLLNDYLQASKGQRNAAEGSSNSNTQREAATTANGNKQKPVNSAQVAGIMRVVQSITRRRLPL